VTMMRLNISPWRMLTLFLTNFITIVFDSVSAEVTDFSSSRLEAAGVIGPSDAHALPSSTFGDGCILSKSTRTCIISSASFCRSSRGVRRSKDHLKSHSICTVSSIVFSSSQFLIPGAVHFLPLNASGRSRATANLHSPRSFFPHSPIS